MIWFSVTKMFSGSIPDCSPRQVPHLPQCSYGLVYDIKFGMLQVRKNEISLRKCTGDSAQSCTLEGTLVTRESARFDKYHDDNEPKSPVRLLMFPEENQNFSNTRIVKRILSFSQCQTEHECLSRRGNCRPQSGRILK